MKHAILGFVQGITEFLPISSSGHLVISQHFFGIKSPGVTLEVFLHLATLFAILFFFKRDIRHFFTFKGNEWGKNPLIILVVIASLPIVIVGVLFKDKIESMFESIDYVKFFFLINGFILFTTLFSKGKREDLSLSDALLVGLGQAVALLPGISRSGTTITVALILGINKERAFKFSFLLSIPAILGASLLEVIESGSFTIGCGEILGFLTAFFFGLLALLILRRTVITGKLYLFGLYTLILGGVIFILRC